MKLWKITYRRPEKYFEEQVAVWAKTKLEAWEHFAAHLEKRDPAFYSHEIYLDSFRVTWRPDGRSTSVNIVEYSPPEIINPEAAPMGMGN